MRTQLDVSVYSRSSTRTISGGMPMEWRMCHRQSRSTESNATLKAAPHGAIDSQENTECLAKE